MEVWISRKRKCGPGGITFDSPRNNQIVVVDQGNHRIQIFDEKGTFIRTFGSEGNDDGRLIDPSGVAIDQEGNYVVSNDFCIQVFDSAGKFLRKLDQREMEMGSLNFLLVLEFCQMEISWWGVTFKVNVKSSIHWATL